MRFQTATRIDRNAHSFAHPLFGINACLACRVMVGSAFNVHIEQLAVRSIKAKVAFNRIDPYAFH